ncbi:MAG: UPF0758 domain-containing protein [Methanomicrobiales archaeon]
MKYVPLLDRPREKIAKRCVASLIEQELIESILGRGTQGKDVREIAKEIFGLVQDHQGTIQYVGLISIKGQDRQRQPRSPHESTIKVT